MAKGIVGAQMYTLRDHLKTLPDIVESLRKVRAAGYSAIQVSGFGPVYPRDLARAIEDAGLIVTSTHMAWADFTGKIDETIETHKLWKCSHPAIGGLRPEYRGLDGLKRFIDELHPVMERLTREGMDFSYHNHSHELARIETGKTWLEELYSRTSGDLLKAEVDTYWITHGGGDPAAWIRMLGKRQPLLHLKDMVVTVEKEQRFAPVGEGDLNWPAILAAAEEVGVEHYFVEQDNSYDDDPFECLAVSYRNLAAMGLK